LDALLAEGRRDEALELFMRLAGSPDEQIEAARQSPMRPGLRALAHTLAYDATCLRDRRPHPARLAKIRQQTLVATGGNVETFEGAADAIAKSIPQTERRTIVGQPHIVDPQTFAPVLRGFFTA
jgi:hypothetical protein